MAHDEHATWHLEPSRKRMQLQFTNLPEFHIFVELQRWDQGQGFDLASQILVTRHQVGAAHCEATDDNNNKQWPISLPCAVALTHTATFAADLAKDMSINFTPSLVSDGRYGVLSVAFHATDTLCTPVLHWVLEDCSRRPHHDHKRFEEENYCAL